MKCREFIFLQTSGQLNQASFSLRSSAAMHRWMCVKCRSFARNDVLLDGLLAEWRESLMREADGNDSGGEGSRGP